MYEGNHALVSFCSCCFILISLDLSSAGNTVRTYYQYRGYRVQRDPPRATALWQQQRQRLNTLSGIKEALSSSSVGMQAD
jgi:hypothetical protein